MKIEGRWVETPPLTFSSNLPDAQDIHSLLVLSFSQNGCVPPSLDSPVRILVKVVSQSEG